MATQTLHLNIKYIDIKTAQFDWQLTLINHHSYDINNKTIADEIVIHQHCYSVHLLTIGNQVFLQSFHGQLSCK